LELCEGAAETLEREHSATMRIAIDKERIFYKGKKKKRKQKNVRVYLFIYRIGVAQ
jgi:hypothetical protein